MKTLVWEAISTLNMRDYDVPQVVPGEVLVKVNYAGICGSEVIGYLGHSGLRVPPIVMGHEFAGIIAEIGPDVTADLSVGQAVTVNPLDYCGECELCQQGLTQLCPKRRLIGAHRPGAFAEYVTAPAKLVMPLPDGMSTRVGSLTEPTGVAVRAAELAGDVSSQDVLVIGAGPIGLLTLQALQVNGAKRVFIAELEPARLAMGEALGGIPINPAEKDTVSFIHAETGGKGVPVAIDAVGTAKTRDQCTKSLRTTGTLILSGLHEEVSAMPAADMIRREITAKGAYGYTLANFAKALDLLAAGKIKLDPWMVDAPLSDGGVWFERLLRSEGGAAKVLLVPS